MPEVLTRARSDSILSRSIRASGAHRGVVRRFAYRARALPARVYVGAALSALLVGIGVNALLLQRERHPAPLFAPLRAQTTPVSGPPPASENALHSTSTPTSLPLPPPARTATSEGAPSRPLDRIGDLLRGELQREGSHLIVAAQGALAKLGYAVKTDGAESASTQQALRDFERTHGLPLATEITPHLVKQLTSAARAAGR